MKKKTQLSKLISKRGKRKQIRLDRTNSQALDPIEENKEDPHEEDEIEDKKKWL